MSGMPISEFPATETWLPTIKIAIHEDLAGGGIEADVTGRLIIPRGLEGVATLVQKARGVTCGLPAVGTICHLFDDGITVDPPIDHARDGDYLEASSAQPVPLLRLRGPVRSLLAAERTMLNLVCHLSGVATMTHQFVKQCEGTAAQIFDTRKTMPGLRSLQKYAVTCGGGVNHRMALHDMVLVKDNHLALAGVAEGQPLHKAIEEVVARSHKEAIERPIEVEVDTMEQFREVLSVDGVDVILLDNMTPQQLQQCVSLRDATGHSTPLLEASGGVSLDTVASIARSGVERISVGAITHSVPSLDLSLDVTV